MKIHEFLNHICYAGTIRPIGISEPRWRGMIRWAVVNGYIT